LTCKNGLKNTESVHPSL